MIGPLPLVEHTIERLKALSVLRSIEGAGDYEAAWEKGPRATPAAFCLLGTEKSSGTAGASGGRLIQRVQVAFGVVIAVKNFRGEELGTAAGTDLASVVGAVRGQLVNWTPPSAKSPFEFSSGRHMGYRAGVAWWQEIYLTEYRLDKTS
jgi:hypothetical protein